MAKNKEKWSYADFEASDSTKASDKNRQNITSQKPGSFTYKDYVDSDAVTQAKNTLNQHLAQKPGEYKSAWQANLDDTINKILNREKFSYDLNGDALYQQYKDQYTLQGQQAMMDTMGQAAAMTGGYGNSYAQTVGQQTYQGYLQQLNDKVPELYKLALDQYNREGDELYNQYGLFADRENQDYGRYRDTVTDWKDDRSFLTDEARYQSEMDYNKYINDRNFAHGLHRDSVSDWQYELGRADEDYWNQYDRDYTDYSNDRTLDYNSWTDSRDYDYKVGRDAVADEQWKATFDEGVRQYNANYAEEQRQFNANLAEDQRQYNSNLAEDQRQYNANLAEEQRQFNAKNDDDKDVTTGGSTKDEPGVDNNGNLIDNKGNGYDNGGQSNSRIRAMQKDLGVEVDGKWGPASQKAAQEKWGTSSADSAWAKYDADDEEGKVENSYEYVENKANEYISYGESISTISQYLREQLQRNVITQEEYNKLMTKYVPRSSSGGGIGGHYSY